MCMEAAGRTQCPPVPTTSAHPLSCMGCCEGRKGPVSPALHSGQGRLKGQSHEVSRWNQESRRAEAETLGQSCFPRVEATAPFPSHPSPTARKNGPFELLSLEVIGHLF